MRHIHRHTGGLEINFDVSVHTFRIHRHTGGLEKEVTNEALSFFIHRHTGGLETKHLIKSRTTLHSPPHRRLRKIA